MLKWSVLLKFSRNWLMINTAIVSNYKSDAFSNTYVIGLNIFALAYWSMFIKNTPKYINGSKFLKKGQPQIAFNQMQSLSTLEMEGRPREGGNGKSELSWQEQKPLLNPVYFSKNRHESESKF